MSCGFVQVLFAGSTSGAQKANEFLSEKIIRCDFALPNDERVPTALGKRGDCSRVTLLISCNLGKPIVLAALRPPSSTAVMTVPEAPVHEDYLASDGEYDVGGTGQAFDIKPITIAGGVK